MYWIIWLEIILYIITLILILFIVDGPTNTSFYFDYEELRHKANKTGAVVLNILFHGVILQELIMVIFFRLFVNSEISKERNVRIERMKDRRGY